MSKKDKYADINKDKWASGWVKKGVFRVYHKDDPSLGKSFSTTEEARSYVVNTDRSLNYGEDGNLVIPEPKVKAVLPGATSQSTFDSDQLYDTALENKKLKLAEQATKDSTTQVKADEVEIDKLYSRMASSRKIIEDLEIKQMTPFGLTPYQENELKMNRQRYKTSYAQLGGDTTKVEASMPESNADKDYSWYNPLKYVQRKGGEAKWKEQKRVDYMKGDNVPKDMIPEGMSKYKYVEQLVNQEWEEMQTADPSTMKIQELIDKQ
jgi:hypothetical protein